MNQLKVGDVLEGFCDGAFGRDSYGEKKVEAVGPDWVVVRYREYSERHADGVELVDICQGDPNELIKFRAGYEAERQHEEEIHPKGAKTGHLCRVCRLGHLVLFRRNAGNGFTEHNALLTCDACHVTFAGTK